MKAGEHSATGLRHIVLCSASTFSVSFWTGHCLLTAVLDSCPFSNGREDSTESHLISDAYVSIQRTSSVYRVISTYIYKYPLHIGCLYRYTCMHRHVCVSINTHSHMIYIVGNARVHTDFLNETVLPYIKNQNLGGSTNTYFVLCSGKWSNYITHSRVTELKHLFQL